MTAPASTRSVSSAEFVSFVPRLTIDWLRDQPENLWREVDGTVAFIDISGFTAMSEQLSSLGRAGAEEVTEVMNATFAALLAVGLTPGLQGNDPVVQALAALAERVLPALIRSGHVAVRRH